MGLPGASDHAVCQMFDPNASAFIGSMLGSGIPFLCRFCENHEIAGGVGGNLTLVADTLVV